jgi:hypothetical protein
MDTANIGCVLVRAIQLPSGSEELQRQLESSGLYHGNCCSCQGHIILAITETNALPTQFSYPLAR